MSWRLWSPNQIKENKEKKWYAKAGSGFGISLLFIWLNLFLFVKYGRVDNEIQLVFCFVYLLVMIGENSEEGAEKRIDFFIPLTLLISMSNGTKAGAIILSVGYLSFFRKRKQIFLTIASVLGVGLLQIATSGNYLWQRLFAESVMSSEQAYAKDLMLSGMGNLPDNLQLPDGYREYFPAFIKGHLGNIFLILIIIIQILLLCYFIQKVKKVEDQYRQNVYRVLIGIYGFRLIYEILMNFGFLPVTSIVLPYVLSDVSYAMFDGLFLAQILH